MGDRLPLSGRRGQGGLRPLFPGDSGGGDQKDAGLIRFFSHKAIEFEGSALPITTDDNKEEGSEKLKNLMRHWDRLSELWFECNADWTEAVMNHPPKFTKPEWATWDQFPFLNREKISFIPLSWKARIMILPGSAGRCTIKSAGLCQPAGGKHMADRKSKDLETVLAVYHTKDAESASAALFKSRYHVCAQKDRRRKVWEFPAGAESLWRGDLCGSGGCGESRTCSGRMAGAEESPA